jgi:hypothetical protein
VKLIIVVIVITIFITLEHALNVLQLYQWFHWYK